MCSSFSSTVTGFPVPVWSFSTCLGVKTQRFVDSCPDTGFPVLVEFLTSSRANLVRSRDSFLHPATGFPILDNWVLVFSSIRWMSLLLLATSESPNPTSNYLCRKFSVVVEVTHTLSGIWLLQISSQSPSRYNKLGVYRVGWLRSTLFDRNSILSAEQTVCRPVHRVLMYFPFFLVRCKTWFGQIKLFWILVILVHGIHGCKEYRLSVPARILSSRYQSWICDSVNWLHIQNDKCNRRN